MLVVMISETRRFLTSALVLGAAAAAACGGSGDGQSTTSTQGGAGHGGTSTLSETTGTGGTTTHSASTGGSGGCATAAECDDGIACTVDTCNAGQCGHSPGPNSGPTACPAGSYCEVGNGCVPGVICATTAQCVTQLGGDPCKTNIACDGATSTCTFTILDKDGDGHPPVVCGGDDCNDADASIYPGAPEICDGKSNGCAGMPADQGATCPGLEVCTAGGCTCPAANACGADCVDKNTDPNHCGNCTTKCPSAATCQAGQCICASGATVCNGACVDIKTDPLHCNGCNQACATGYACQNGACACLATACGGACIDTQTDPAHCGNCTTACTGGATCQAGQCVCPAGLTLCGNACVDTKSDPTNCNGCGVVCGACQNGQCIACPTADLYIEQDLSGSMTGVRWDGARLAINAFATDTASAGLGLGIGYFPLAANLNSCVVADFAVPDVGLALLPGTATAITTSTNAHSANGMTPLKEALEGALTYAKSWAIAHATHNVSVVLISDGLPTICTATNATQVATVASAYATGTPAVKTFVIGIGGDVTAADWNQIANAGGTGTAYLANDSVGVKTALDGIRAAIKTCP